MYQFQSSAPGPVPPPAERRSVYGFAPAPGPGEASGERRPAYGSVGAPVLEPIKDEHGPLVKATPRTVFVGVGLALLGLLVVVPVWNAMSLLHDSNYTFWCGRTVPTWMIALCITVVVMYGITVAVFFSSARQSVQTEQTVMMIANVFVTLLGLVLVLVSLPLSQQSIYTYNNLMHRCDYSDQTHRLYEHSQVLQSIRQTEECSSEYSVESCDGYTEEPPYTSFLKTMEDTFRCSGFCYRVTSDVQAVATNGGAPSTTEAAGVTMGATTTASPGRSGSSLLSFRSARRHGARAGVASSAALASLARANRTRAGAGRAATKRMRDAHEYPPTLFSDADYQASCEGMAARDMKNFAGDISYQTFFQGIYLIVIAVATGFLKLIGFCVRKDRDVQYGPARGLA